VPLLNLRHSPHAPGFHPVSIHYRDFGAGPPLIFLHGGWGYGIYPFDYQIAAFSTQFRILIPDRSGYGHSTQIHEALPLDFHRRAAAETIAFLDAMEIERAIFWGHSDGAVIAAITGLTYPERCERLILEAFHFFRRKPGSRSFFSRFAAHPEELGEETRKLLAQDHGEFHWQMVVQRNCRVWLRIGDFCLRPDDDLYEGHLGKLAVPALFLHGRLDPRTEPGEMDRVQEAIPAAAFRIVEAGQHSPHSEPQVFQECNQAVREFLAKSP
jgi:pimeloyl-ACP methyl ester carboxylesterase